MFFFSQEYKDYKRERAQILWDTIERIIPDIKQRVEVEIYASPLTHQRFLRRHRGTYGPALPAGGKLFGVLPLPEVRLFKFSYNTRAISLTACFVYYRCRNLGCFRRFQSWCGAGIRCFPALGSPRSRRVGRSRRLPWRRYRNTWV